MHKLHSTHFWKPILGFTLFVGLLTLVYTLANLEEMPAPPEEAAMSLTEPAALDGAESLVSHFTRARSLSEDYLMETETMRLVSIEVEFDRRLSAIETELIRLSRTDDEGVGVLVANLMRLKSTLEREAKTSFRQHRRVLGCGG